MNLVLVSFHELCTSRHILGMYSLFETAQQPLYMETCLPIGVAMYSLLLVSLCFLLVFVFCSRSLKYGGVSASWIFMEKVHCSGICSSYPNLLGKLFLIFRDFFCLRNSPFANSSTAEKKRQQYLLKHPSQK